MKRVKAYYWVLISATILEILNLIVRVFPEYYVNRGYLFFVLIVLTMIGLEAGVKKWVVLTLGTVLAVLILAMLFIVWN